MALMNYNHIHQWSYMHHAYTYGTVIKIRTIRIYAYVTEQAVGKIGRGGGAGDQWVKSEDW